MKYEDLDGMITEELKLRLISKHQDFVVAVAAYVLMIIMVFLVSYNVPHLRKENTSLKAQVEFLSQTNRVEKVTTITTISNVVERVK